MVYCTIRGYDEQMFTISLGVYLYKMVDGLADVYEGRLQQVDKLYLSGVSQAFRSVVVLVVFSLCLLVTRNLAVSCMVMAVAAFATFIVLTFPLAHVRDAKVDVGTSAASSSCSSSASPCSWRCSCTHSSTTCRSS